MTEEKARSGALGEPAQKAMAVLDMMTEIVKDAKRPGFTTASWDRMAALFDTENFGRIGPFLDVMDWRQYLEMLTQWATTTDFYSNFRRISVSGNLVFLEVEEHNTPQGGTEIVVNSMNVFNFDDAGKICFLNIYLQAAWSIP